LLFAREYGIIHSDECIAFYARRARDNSKKQRGNSECCGCFFGRGAAQTQGFLRRKTLPMADNFMEKQQKTAGRPFEKGRSGNPAGRPRGSRNRATRAMQRALEGDAQALTRKAVELALDGNTTALRLCLDRLLAPRRDRPAPLKFPPVEDAGGLAGAMAAIVGAAGKGEISSKEAGGWARLVDIFLKALETHDFEQRLDALEKRLGPG
jgi:hypothetical protein